MSLFNGKALFESGPSRFQRCGVKQRVDEHDQPNLDGTAISALGQTALRIEQNGTLLADDLVSLDEQWAAIEVMVDGRVYSLIDHMGRTFESMMMLSFTPGEIRRIGLRFALDYQIDYLQNA